MAPVTDFHVKEKYTYLNGFGSYHSSEALPGANPLVNNSPQKPPYGLRTERISGTSFTAPRDQNLQTWLYRMTSSLDHSEFIPIEDPPEVPSHTSPNSYMWPSFPTSTPADWTKQTLLARNGDPNKKEGLSIWLFAIDQSMEEHHAFSSLDGEMLIIPQAGAIDIQTEMGKLLVRQNEIAVIPRGVRHRVTLPEDAGPARGYICELYQGHFRLPDLGIVGSTGLANVRDFQIPTAYFQGGQLLSQENILKPINSETWTISTRSSSRLYRATQTHTPFDVVAWHGTNYPYKYDLARFNVLTNALFDEHDPSLFVVLTAPNFGKEPGTAIIDFAILSPRYQVSENTFWLPYYHRNCMSEFYAPIINAQNPSHPFNNGKEFMPFGAGLNGPNVTHGANEEDFQKATHEENTYKPKKVMDDGISIMLIETELPLFLSTWAEEAAVKNFGSGRNRPSVKSTKSKM